MRVRRTGGPAGYGALVASLSVGAALLWGAVGCRQEQPADVRGASPASRARKMGEGAVRQPGVQPGLSPSVVLGELFNPYAGDPAAAIDGRKLFVWYNCSGCHGGRAGGGMGPSLRDSLWLYGSDDTHVYATILEGRSAGMPAWGPKLPEQQIWELVSYLRTLGTPDEPDRVEPRERQGFKTPGGLEVPVAPGSPAALSAPGRAGPPAAAPAASAEAPSAGAPDSGGTRPAAARGSPVDGAAGESAARRDPAAIPARPPR